MKLGSTLREFKTDIGNITKCEIQRDIKSHPRAGDRTKCSMKHKN